MRRTWMAVLGAVLVWALTFGLPQPAASIGGPKCSAIGCNDGLAKCAQGAYVDENGNVQLFVCFGEVHPE